MFCGLDLNYLQNFGKFMFCLIYEMLDIITVKVCYVLFYLAVFSFIPLLLIVVFFFFFELCYSFAFKGRAQIVEIG